MNCLRLLIACALVTVLGPQQGAAEDTSEKEIRIGFGILLDNAEPIAGKTVCKVGQTCRLFEQKSPKLTVDLEVTAQAGSWTSEMWIDCERDCSLANGRSHMKLQSQRELDLFSGEETGIFTLLVSKPRKTMGKYCSYIRIPGGYCLNKKSRPHSSMPHPRIFYAFRVEIAPRHVI